MTRPPLRDWIAWRLASAALRIATPGYRHSLERAWRLGIAVLDIAHHRQGDQ